MTSLSRTSGHFPRAAASAWCATAALLLSAPALLPSCAAGEDGVGSTDTGNPPAIDKTALRVEASNGGVVVRAAAGGVPAGAHVVVENTTTGDEGTTTADDDGAFEVELPGSVADDFRVEVEVDGATSSVTVTGDGDPNGLSNLVGNDYLLDASTNFTPEEGTTVRLSFKADEFSISGGCNSLGGEYSFCDGKLCASSLFTTEIGCPAELHAQDEWLGDFFTSTPSLELDGATLTVTGEDATLVFVDTEVQNPDRPLTGRTWLVDTFIDGDAASNFAGQAEPTLEFRDDGTVRVFSGCSTANGDFEVNGAELELENLAYPEIGCAEMADNAVHDFVVRVMTDGTVEFSIDEARLTVMRGTIGLGATTD